MAQDGRILVAGRCLQGSGTGNGATVVLKACTQSAAQRWQLGPRGQLVNIASGRCLDDPSGKTANGTKLDLRACSTAASAKAGTSQRWTDPAAPIASQTAGACLNDPNGKTANGTAVTITKCTGAVNQKWTAEPDGTIRHAGKCLQAQAAGTSAVLHACDGAAAQRWTPQAQGQFGSDLIDSAGACLGPGSRATTVMQSCWHWWQGTTKPSGT